MYPIRPSTWSKAISRSTSRLPEGQYLVPFHQGLSEQSVQQFTGLLSNGYSTTPIYNTVGDWSRTIGNNLVNDARFGWSHITLNSGNSLASNVGQFGNTLGIGNGNPGTLPGLLALNFSNSARYQHRCGRADAKFRRPCVASRGWGELEPWSPYLQIRRSILASDHQDVLCRQQWRTGSHGLRWKVHGIRNRCRWHG